MKQKSTNQNHFRISLILDTKEKTGNEVYIYTHPIWKAEIEITCGKIIQYSIFIAKAISFI